MTTKTVNSTVGSICICIPQYYYPQPILSQLISEYGLTVNIAAAFLETDTRDNGWFKLEIEGSSPQVEAALAYLQAMNIEIEQLNLENLVAENREQLHFVCVNSDCNGCIKSIDYMQNHQQQIDLTDTNTINRAKFQICIPKNYRYSPIIAGLISCYGLTVNIVGAFLDTNTNNDGWFDLELSGKPQQIVFGLRYLKKLGLQIWL